MYMILKHGTGFRFAPSFNNKLVYERIVEHVTTILDIQKTGSICNHTHYLSFNFVIVYCY